MAKKVFIVAGDASGDVYGAQVITALRSKDPKVEIAGLGGDKMKSAGMEFLYNLVREFSVVGFLPVILGMPKVMRFLEITLDYIDTNKPDVVLLIDYPGFNMYLSTHIEKRKIPVIYYVTPQIWAWAPWRIRKIKRYISKMLVIFPFEVDFYQQANVPVEYVGHPLLDRLALFQPAPNFAKQQQLKSGKILGLLPGSRRIEITLNLPLMLWMAARLVKQCKVSQICIALAASKYLPLVCELIEKHGQGLPEIRVIVQDAYNTIYHSHFLLVTSGTATLEVAMMAKPMSVLYRVRFYHKWIVENTSFLKCKYIALPNIISNKMIVPEHLVCENKPDYLVEEMCALWSETPQREKCLADLSSLKEKLKQPGASLNVAKSILNMIQ